MAAEVLPLAEACRFLERRAPRILRPRRYRARLLPLWLARLALEIRRDPFGVVLIISPSNYLLLLPGVQLVQALIAGNAVVVKPGRTGRPVMQVLVRIMADVGFDTSLCRVLDESTESARQAIEAGVDKVVLTGSASTGRAVLVELGPRLVPSTMELSGCDAVYVREDADVEMVVRGLAFGLRFNSAATCIGPHRVFVPRSLACELESRLTVAVERIGSCDVDADVAERARGLVEKALAAGARRLTGEIRPGECFFPVVLADASPDMDLLKEDVFSPVIAIVLVGSDEEALELSSKCPYALGATVFGGERAAMRLARKVPASAVIVNDMIVPTAHPALPFGGRGQSGYGVTRGAEGLLEMTQVRSIAVRKGRFRPHLDDPMPGDEALLRDYLLSLHGPGFRSRLRAFFRTGWDLLHRKEGKKTPQTRSGKTES